MPYIEYQYSTCHLTSSQRRHADAVNCRTTLTCGALHEFREGPSVSVTGIDARNADKSSSRCTPHYDLETKRSFFRNYVAHGLELLKTIWNAIACATVSCGCIAVTNVSE